MDVKHVNELDLSNIPQDTESPIIVVLGDKGSGKTLFLTYIAEYSYYILNRKIYSNYHLNNIPYEYITFSDIENLPEDMQNGVIVLDEGQQGAHAYDFFTSRTRNITTLLTQLRKRGLDLFISTQRWKQMAKSIRDLTDYKYLLEVLKDNHGVVKGCATVSVHDHMDDKVAEFVFDGRKMFNHYNTKEIITTK